MLGEYPEPQTAVEMIDRYRDIRRRVYAAPQTRKPKPPKAEPGIPGSISKPPITYDNPVSIVREADKEYKPSVREIAEDILSCQNRYEWKDIIGARRKRDLIRWRKAIVAHACRERPDKTLPIMGRIFGGRDHTTILYSERFMEDAIAKDAVIWIETPKGRKVAILPEGT